MLQTRIANSFPPPIRDKMKNFLLLAEKNKKNSSSKGRGEEVIIAERVKLLYSRLAGTLTSGSIPCLILYHVRLYQD